MPIWYLCAARFSGDFGVADAASVPDQFWTYQEWNELDGYPYWGTHATYSGGGYEAQLGKYVPRGLGLSQLVLEAGQPCLVFRPLVHFGQCGE